MKSDILSPKQLFQKDVRYVIPTFQRPYVWTQEDQWEPLWDDVRNTAERYLDELERLGIDRKADAERLTTAHFLGAVVLQQQATSAIEIEQRHVIDGQQRLTTLSARVLSSRLRGWSVATCLRDSASSYHLDRRGIEEVRATLRRGKADVVIAYAVDRQSEPRRRALR